MGEKTKAPVSECPVSFSCSKTISARDLNSNSYPTRLQTLLQQELYSEIENKFTPKKIRSLELVGKYQEISQDNLSVDSDGCIVSTSVSRKFSRKASRVRSCGSFLEFHQYPDKNRLHQANFCKDRLCPMCNWRRSLKIFGQLSEIIEALKSSADYSDVQFLFLTLTIRNPSPEEFPSALSALFSGWRKLYMKRSVFQTGQIVGSFRSLEITYHEDTNTFHPHLHVILAVRPSYFKGKNYISQKRWSQLWQECMDLDYSPVVDIRKTYSKDSNISASEIASVTAAITEAAKYATKDTDYLDYDNSEITRVLSEALEGVRLIGYTGCFSKIRKLLKHDDAEDGDLIHTSPDDIQQEVAYAVIRLSWVNGFYKIT